ncbi:MAG: DUF1963 domain-containing protein [Odoribacteraceae bacterium]|nr:DUF1963 domain-containing protein [Odoribacteraceae bacterium]
MGLFRLFGNKDAARGKSAPAREIAGGTIEGTAGKIAALFKERTAVESIRLKPAREACAPWDSKLGGAPYLPGGFDYPRDRQEGREGVPLRFLAQLNFSEMPALAGFPERGILQFYTGNDEQHGMDYETLTAQKGFRVVYHEEVTGVSLPPPPPGAGDEMAVASPVDGELRLRFAVETSVMGPGDFRFDALLLQFYNEVTGSRFRSLDRVPERLLDDLYERLSASGHRVGGYPTFTQLDPREYHDYLREHTVLLLQLDSETTGDYSIAWRNAGSCHFFIRPDDLAAREFFEVLYSWDCY